MDEAPLTLAHTFAKRASQETQKARLSTAASEHESAAGEFAKASTTTEDFEALRILKLLEDHHHKLAQIIRWKDAATRRLSEEEPAFHPTDRDSDVLHPDDPATAPVKDQLEKPSTPTLLRIQNRRDSSPALAKDMASRRGIPQSQQRKIQVVAPSVSPSQATGTVTKVSNRHPIAETHARNTSHASPQDRTKHPQSDNAVSGTASYLSADKSGNKDEGFAKFYSNITSGPLSRLSSMLAFAGLPLADDENDQTQEPPKTDKTSVRVTSGPDVKHLFSGAALRAMEEQHRNSGFSGTTFGPGESFYVIPTSGGTASYANIVSKAQQDGQPQQFRSIGEGSDEFVDARETPAGHSPRLGRGPAIGGPLQGSFREEELQLQNDQLKQILDKLSHRLQAFESHAQDASMAALTQSMASVRTQPAGPTPELEERMRAMEAQLEREMREREKLGLENQKQKQVIAKYRSHWEQLKDSARAKERAKREQSAT